MVAHPLARLLAPLAIVSAVGIVQAQPAEGPQVGEPAPAIELEGLLHAPEGAPAPNELGWDDLKGNVVVLEFWATWCGPCIAAIPHLNALTEEFKGKPVRFISVTDEDETKVRKFLEKRTMSSWIGLDTDRSLG